MHHDRLIPLRNFDEESVDMLGTKHSLVNNDITDSSDSSDSEGELTNENIRVEIQPDAPVRRYPLRDRHHREIPGAIPWEAVSL